MSVYNQSTPLSTGRLTPSVNYNASIRMPTQPMPELPDVNSSFNIDLRPVGEAILAGKEMEWKSKEAELDRQARERELERSFDNQVAIKQMEINSIEKRHAADNSRQWYDSITNRMKVEKEEDDDTFKILKRQATDWLTIQARNLDADKNNNKKPMSTVQIAAREKQIIDDFRNVFGQTILITDVIDDVRKVYGGFGGSIGAESRAYTKSVEESQKDVEDSVNDTAGQMSQYNGATISFNRTKMAKYNDALDEVDTLKAKLSRTDLTQEERDLTQKKLDESIAYIGGESVDKYLTSLNVLQLKDYNTLKQAKEGFIQTVVNEDYTLQSAEVLWNMVDNRRGYTRTVEAVSKMDEKILKQYETAIKTLIAGNKIGLLNNIPGLSTFAAIKDISPELAESFMDAANFEDLISTMGSDTALTITDAQNGSFIIKHGDKDVEVRPDQVKAIKNATGMEDFTTAWRTLYAKNIMKRINSGTEPSLNFAADMMTPKNDSVNEALTANYNTVALAKSINPKTALEYAKNNPHDRGAQTLSAAVKILAHINTNYKEKDSEVLYTEFTSKIHKMRVNGFLSDYIKGGTIEIRTDDKGKLHLWRTAEGIAGGVGFIEGYKALKEVETFLNNIELTASERVAFLETQLGKGYFFTYPTGDMPTVKDYAGRIIDVFQNAAGVLIDVTAGTDTGLAYLASQAVKATSIENLEEIWNDFINGKYKEADVKSSANAELRVQHVVPPTASMTDFETFPLVKNEDGSVSNVKTEIVEMDGIYYIKPTMGDTSKHFGGYKTLGDADKADKQMHKELNDIIAVKEQQEQPTNNVRTVSNLAEMEQKIAEDSKLKKKPAESEGDITTTLPPLTGIIKKEKLDSVEATLPNYESDIIAVMSE